MSGEGEKKGNGKPSAKAERELSLLARPHLMGLQDALYWFASNGYLRPPANTPALTGRSRLS